MALKNSSEYKYLLLLYSRVDDFLSKTNPPEDELPESIVSFGVAVEKILKIKLYHRNPLLVFETSCIKENDALSIIALRKERNIETAKIKDILARFEIIFKTVFTTDELQALIDIYNVRNEFIHGYKPDNKIDLESEDIIRKMGTIWEKISPIAISLFGKENIKNGRPKRKYTEKELEQVLENEVRQMIQPLREPFAAMSLNAIDTTSYSMMHFTGDRCPRCGTNAFSMDNLFDIHSSWMNVHSRQIYKCKYCNLELTEKQYGIAKKLITS